MEKATGDIFGFINSDDVYLPGTFAAVAEYFESHPASEWVCGDTIMFGEGRPTELIRANVPIALANDGEDIEVWRDGEQTRSYCPKYHSKMAWI